MRVFAAVARVLLLHDYRSETDSCVSLDSANQGRSESGCDEPDAEAFLRKPDLSTKKWASLWPINLEVLYRSFVADE
jgi:hypothetical protein